MFEKNLQDLVKGLRNNKGDASAYIAKELQAIKEEAKSRDVGIKSQALAKATYVRAGRRAWGGGRMHARHG